MHWQYAFHNYLMGFQQQDWNQRRISRINARLSFMHRATTRYEHRNRWRWSKRSVTNTNEPYIHLYLHSRAMYAPCIGHRGSLRIPSWHINVHSHLHTYMSIWYTCIYTYIYIYIFTYIYIYIHISTIYILYIYTHSIYIYYLC